MGAGDSKPLLQQAVNVLLTKPVTLRSKRLSDIAWAITNRSPEKVGDLVAWMALDDLRRLRDRFPRNFAVLILMLVEKLEELIETSQKAGADEALEAEVEEEEEEEAQSLPEPRSVPLPKLSAKESAVVVHLLRVLIRCMPVLLEVSYKAEQPEYKWVNTFLWGNRLPPYPSTEREDVHVTVVATSFSKRKVQPSSSDKAPGEAAVVPAGEAASQEAAATGAAPSREPAARQTLAKKGSQRSMFGRISAILFLSEYDSGEEGGQDDAGQKETESKSVQSTSGSSSQAESNGSGRSVAGKTSAGKAEFKKDGETKEAGDNKKSALVTKQGRQSSNTSGAGAEAGAESKSSESASGTEENEENEEPKLVKVPLAQVLAEEEASCHDLGKRIVNIGLNLLFIRGGTLPEDSVSPIWLPTKPLKGTSRKAMDNMRMEVLRLLLVLCSEPLLVPASQYTTAPKPFLQEVAEMSRVQAHRSNLFFSLLNVVIMYWPGGNIFSHSKDAASHVIDLACHLLLLLLDYKPITGVATEAQTPDPTADLNLYKELLASIDDDDDFDLILTGLTRLLTNVVEGPDTPLLRTERQVDCYEELLLLTWKILEGNPEFLKYVVSKPGSLKLLDLLFASVYHASRDSVNLGAMHVAFFNLLLLISQRPFAIRLSTATPASAHPVLKLGRSFRGCYGDVLIHVIYKVISTGGSRVVPLYSCLLTIIANCTPYIKSLNITSANHLIALLNFFASPPVFFANDRNYLYTKFLLESVNNLLQYQASGNEPLLLCICQKPQVFRTLLNLELPSPQQSPPQPAVLPRAPEANNKSSDASKDDSDEALLGGTLTEHVAQPSRELGGIGNGGAGGSGEEQLTVSDVALRAAEASPAIGESQHVQPWAAKSQPPSQGTQAPLHKPAGSQWGSSNSEADSGSRAWRTPEWLKKVQRELPLATVASVLQTVLPQVEAVASTKQYAHTSQLVQYLRESTLVGILPLPHPITVRKYRRNSYTDLWFTIYLYGLIFLHQSELSTLPVVDASAVQLFGVSVLPEQ